MLCSLCQSLPPLWEMRGYAHHTIGSLKQSAAGGCPVCSVLWAELEPTLALEPLAAVDPGQIVRLSMDNTRVGKAVRLTLDFGAKHSLHQLELFRDPDSSSSSARTHTQTAPHQHAVTSVYSDSHQSDETFGFVRAALEHCTAAHDPRCCVRNDDVELPTLVLDVATPSSSGSGSVTLCHNADGTLRGRYLTLSYCWGPASVQAPTRLTKARLASYTNNKEEKKEAGGGILLASLPPTLQDAVATVRRLGFRYLWIDSLCIVQDDEALRQQQLCKMARIYMASFATILAAVPDSAAEGFLGRRQKPATAPVRLAFETDAATGTTSYVLAQPEGRGLMARAATSERAWIFQETVLSTRLIRFGACSVDVLCRSETKTEYDSSTQSLGPSDYYRLRPDLNLSTSLLAKLSPRTVVATRTYQREALEAWYRTVGFYYSERLCTNSDDRLAALAAYAEEAHKVIGGDYHAGLWSVDLVRGLQWKPASGFLGGGTKVKYRAPSWSWAAYDGRVQFHAPRERPAGLKDAEGTTQGPTVIGAWTSTTDAASSAASNASPSPYGACRSGRLVLEARVGQVSAAPDNILQLLASARKHNSVGSSMVMLQGPGTKEAVCSAWPDTEAGIPCGRVLRAAFLAYDMGLVLIEDGQGNGTHGKETQYRRIGHFRFSEGLSLSAQAWKNACVKIRITLV